MRNALLAGFALFGGCCGGSGLFDFDGDGFKGRVDCDNFDEDIRPDAGERCDGGGVDEDCDGDVDDDDDDLVNPKTWYLDLDGDGYGDDGHTREACVADDDEVAHGGDCNETDAAINPGAAEVCDGGGVDEDCDDLADDDDDDVTLTTTFHVDADGDNYGDPNVTEEWCDPPQSVVSNGEDCDDSDEDVNPGELEHCDDGEVDEDCDGLVDDADPDVTDLNIWYVDADRDGFGSDDDRSRSCDAPTTTAVEEGGDCDDANSRINPDAEEVCADGIDQDCDGAAIDCVVRGDLDDATADARVAFAEAGAMMGWSMAAGGDTDGDGFAEVWLGTPARAGASTGTGGAVRIAGRLSGEDSPTSFGLLVLGSTSATELGYTVASGADLDGDSVDDVLLGAPLDGSSDAGAIYLLPGGTADGATEADATSVRSGYATRSYLGFSMAVGDYDGDGAADLFATDDVNDCVYIEAGPLREGSSSFLSLSNTWFQVTTQDKVAVGDLDGDGMVELAVGDWGLSRVWIFAGGETGSLDTGDAMATLDSDYSAIALGFSLSVGPDLDADGYGDLVAGAPNTDDYMGMVYVLNGPLSGTYADDDVDLEIRAEVEGEYFGYSVAVSADMNQDGLAELAVGAPGESTEAGNGGAVYLFDGQPSRGAHTADEAETILLGTTEYGQDGYTVGFADLDGDGSSDLVAGAFNLGVAEDGGGALVFYGSTY